MISLLIACNVAESVGGMCITDVIFGAAEMATDKVQRLKFKHCFYFFFFF